MKYKFEQFNATIENPVVTVKNVNDNLTAKTCNVEVLLTTDSAELGVNLSGFNYVASWEDTDIQAWVNTKLQEYAI